MIQSIRSPTATTTRIEIMAVSGVKSMIQTIHAQRMNDPGPNEIAAYAELSSYVDICSTKHHVTTAAEATAINAPGRVRRRWCALLEGKMRTRIVVRNVKPMMVVMRVA
jgi:hypothetical protein